MTPITTPTDDRARRLAKVEKAYERSAEKSEGLRQERNQLMHDAIEAGWTHAQIARATGLTRGRVGQIMMAANRPENEEASGE